MRTIWTVVAAAILAVRPCAAQHDRHGHDHGQGHQDEHHEEHSTSISGQAQEESGILLETAGPGMIATYERVYGRILADENRVAHVKPRFSGVVKSIAKSLGDEVKKGDLLAVIESNQSLRPYEIRSAIDGRVVERHATIGEAISEDRTIFVVADLSEVWADFLLYRHDVLDLTAGRAVTIDLGDGRPEIEARISYISPVTDEATQSRLVRAVLPNRDGRIAPGLFVSGRIALSRVEVPVAVAREALQKMEGKDVVFAADGETFRALEVEVGRADSEHAEILSGLEAGKRYVSKNSFVVKADIQKESAGHQH